MRRFLAVASALCLALAALWYGSKLPLDEQLLGLTAWLQGAGIFGALVYLLGFVVASLLFLPGLPMVMAAGYVYGPVFGFLLALPAATAAAAATFLTGRYVGRSWVEQRLTRHPRLLTLQAATAKDGFKLVVLLRLSPMVPFTLLGYVMGLSRIRFWDFIIASTLGKIPSLILYIYLASAVTQLQQLHTATQSDASRIFFWLGLVATGLAFAWIVRFAQAKSQTLLQGSGRS